MLLEVIGDSGEDSVLLSDPPQSVSCIATNTE